MIDVDGNDSVDIEEFELVKSYCFIAWYSFEQQISLLMIAMTLHLLAISIPYHIEISLWHRVIVFQVVLLMKFKSMSYTRTY